MLISLNLLFIIYYSYVLYVFYLLNKNQCNCKKMEDFKKSWNFYYIITITPILLLFNCFSIYKIYFNKQYGGSLYYKVLFFINLGYFFSFFNDFAILNLFYIMKEKKCPCHVKERKITTYSTYFKLIINILIYIYSINKIDKNKINKLYNKLNKHKY